MLKFILHTFLDFYNTKIPAQIDNNGLDLGSVQLKFSSQQYHKDDYVENLSGGSIRRFLHLLSNQTAHNLISYISCGCVRVFRQRDRERLGFSTFDLEEGERDHEERVYGKKAVRGSLVLLDQWIYQGRDFRRNKIFVQLRPHQLHINNLSRRLISSY